MEFEWDEHKRQITLLERGVDFIDAVLIWDDPFRQNGAMRAKIMAKPVIKRLAKANLVFCLLCIRCAYTVKDDR